MDRQPTKYDFERAEREFGPKTITEKSNTLLVSRAEAPSGQLGFSWYAVEKYLSANCDPARNDCPDGVLMTDCTHFIAHALNKTGVFVKIPKVECASGLCVNAREMATAFQNAAGRYSNVTLVSSYEDTRKGDFVFLPRLWGLDYYHAMVLAAPAKKTTTRHWSHSYPRCGNEDIEYIDDRVFYRISDSGQ